MNETFISAFTGAAIDSSIGVLQKIVQIMQIVALMAEDGVYATTTVTNPEWKNLIVDYDNKILAGVKVDNTIFIADI